MDEGGRIFSQTVSIQFQISDLKRSINQQTHPLITSRAQDQPDNSFSKTFMLCLDLRPCGSCNLIGWKLLFRHRPARFRAWSPTPLLFVRYVCRGLTQASVREHTSGSGRLGCTHVGIRGRGQKSRSSSRLEASIFWWTSHATPNPQVSFSFLSQSLLPLPPTPYPLLWMHVSLLNMRLGGWCVCSAV